MVDLPEAERPVSQMVRPGWWRRAARSRCEREGCQVMLLGRRGRVSREEGCGSGGGGGGGGTGVGGGQVRGGWWAKEHTYVAIVCAVKVRILVETECFVESRRKGKGRGGNFMSPLQGAKDSWRM